MRQSREAKAQSHQTIVSAAARLFRKQGVDGTSVADVMQAAKMTHGGFYRHFQSKDELLAAAVNEALAEVVCEIETRSQSDGPQAAVRRYASVSLGEDHVRHAELGCPIVALGSEAGRMCGAVSAAFAMGIERLVGTLSARLPGPKKTARARAARMLASLVGAVVIARATGDADIGREVREACREGLGV